MEPTVNDQSLTPQLPIDPAVVETLSLDDAHKLIAGWTSIQRLSYANETRSLVVQGKQPSDHRLNLAIACLRMERTGGANKGASKRGSKAPVASMSLDDL